MSKICITGAAGLLGQHLANILKKEHVLLCIDIADRPFEGHKNIEYLQANLLDFPSIRNRLVSFNSDYIFNCAALTDVDRCETDKELAEKLNFELVNHLLSVPFGKIIHYSSDYVFDGKSGPYTEDDPIEPINYYGVTKRHSENILIQSRLNYLIIRTNVIYGVAKNTHTDFVTWVIQSLQKGKSIKAVDDQFNNPTSAQNLAEASIEAALKNINGILHIAGDDYLSRYEVATKIAEYFGNDRHLIIKASSKELPQKAKRPQYGGLNTDKAKKILTTKLLNLKEGLDIYKLSLV